MANGVVSRLFLSPFFFTFVFFSLLSLSISIFTCSCYLNKSHCRGPWKWMDYSVFLHWFSFSIALIEVLNLDKRFYTSFCDTLLPRTNETGFFPLHEITPCNLFLLWFLLRTKSFFVFFFLIACPCRHSYSPCCCLKFRGCTGSKVRRRHVVKRSVLPGCKYVCNCRLLLPVKLSFLVISDDTH